MKHIPLGLNINLFICMHAKAGLYFEQGLYTDYQNVLDSIPAQIDLTDQEADYHTTYSDLYNQIKAWKLDSMPLPLLDSAQLVWLQNFYESNPKMPGIGHALLAINDTSYNITDPVYITDTTVYSGPEPFMLDIKEKETESTKKLVNVYPNPTSKGITLEVKNCGIAESYKIILSDINGREIIKREWPQGEKFVKIDMSHLQGGIYYCTISSQGRIIETHKVLLTK
ncbi:MAG: T9SS type A sorting domain-containing protein [Bacteroidetes bacterium]|nr:T9SS type A sorting domain-containing protein [Bacteroidota bacterium]